MVATKEMY